MHCYYFGWEGWGEKMEFAFLDGTLEGFTLLSIGGGIGAVLSFVVGSFFALLFACLCLGFIIIRKDVLLKKKKQNEALEKQ